MRVLHLHILLPLGLATRLQQKHQVTAQALPLAKLKHLVQDVQASAEAHDEDEVMLALKRSTEEFLDQLRSSVEKEMEALKKKEKKLDGDMKMYQIKALAAEEKGKKSHHAAEGSQESATTFAKSTDKVDHKFHGIKLSVKALLALLENAIVTRNGILITPESPDNNGQPSKVFHTIHRLLVAHPSASKRSTELAQAFKDTSNKMTQHIVNETIAALSVIFQQVKESESMALNQSDAKRVAYESTFVKSTQSQVLASGEQAEAERGKQEVAFSLFMTQAVLRQDREFNKALLAHVTTSDDASDELRKTLKQQQGIFQMLSLVLDTQNKGSSTPKAASGKAPSSSSFLQMQATETVHSRPIQSLTALQSEITLAIQKKQNTHELLRKLTSALHSSLDTQHHLNQVEDLSVTLHNIMVALQNQEDRTAEVKRLCVEKVLKAKGEVALLHSSILLMEESKKYLKKSIKGASHGLIGLDAKGKQLQTWLDKFTKLHQEVAKVQHGHWDDNKTVMLALEKAVHVANALPSEHADITIFLQKLIKSFSQQEDAEHKFLDSEAQFVMAFHQYVKDYQVLLWNRQKHYQDSLTQLRLLYEDAVGSEAWNDEALQNAQALETDAEQLCSKLLAFESHEERTRKAIKEKLTALTSLLV